MNFANGWKTYIVAVATIVAAALGAIPADMTNETVAEILGVVMIIMRSISVGAAGVSLNRTFSVALVGLLLTAPLVGGCMQFAKQVGLTASDCAITQAALDVYTPALSEECATGSGKSKEKACARLRGLEAAMAVCLASTVPVAPAEVAAEKAEILDTVPVPPQAP